LSKAEDPRRTTEGTGPGSKTGNRRCLKERGKGGGQTSDRGKGASWGGGKRRGTGGAAPGGGYKKGGARFGANVRGGRGKVHGGLGNSRHGKIENNGGPGPKKKMGNKVVKTQG